MRLHPYAVHVNGNICFETADSVHYRLVPSQMDCQCIFLLSCWKNVFFFSIHDGKIVVLSWKLYSQMHIHNILINLTFVALEIRV